MLLEVKRLAKKYKNEYVLRDVSFTLAAGELLLVGGENGAGKSTLLQLIAGLLKPDSGTVTLDKIDIFSAHDKLSGRISYVPQDAAVHLGLSVKDNLSFWAGVNGLTGKIARQRVAQVASDLSLTDVLKKKASRLSGGMRKRLNFAIALIKPGQLWLLDEPFANLDTASQVEIADILTRMRNTGCAVMLVAHGDTPLHRQADYIVDLADGRLNCLQTVTPCG